ncbi:hypothetical protein [Spirosoma utsteinense]|uniref:Uncharacterized protein n=1 Tax=Spirosoma utsteinense TaxID=2585773 RepID=A0ABR6W284_9BACT|nr:hypothetical protein [Spirosoma utsteinense]MBC3786018.1 putative protein YdhG (YjbR/CyaY superfamily) [Spirosoma utsteinense]MBC3790716.1 putative protein YdhG (YjbR/CyaY superfamily) [Spirosoma utsteinense]
MENNKPTPVWAQANTPTLKESIRDMIQLQQERHVPDELFWEIFNLRVLLNEQIDMNAFFNPHDSKPGRA